MFNPKRGSFLDLALRSSPTPNLDAQDGRTRVMGEYLDDEFNAGWDEGALPQPEPSVLLVRVVNG